MAMSDVQLQQLMIAVDVVASHLKNASKVMADANSSLTSSLSNIKKAADESGKSLLQQVRAQRLITKSGSVLQQSFEKVSEKLQSHSMTIEAAEKIFRVGNENLASLQKKEEELRGKRLEIEGYQSKVTDEFYAKKIKHLEEEEAIHFKNVKQVEAQVKQYELANEALPKLKDQVVKITKEYILGTLALANFIRGITQTYDITKTSLKFGYAIDKSTSALGGLYDQAKQSIQLGLQPEDYIRLTAENRQATLVMGGTNASFEKINAATSQYIGYIGDLSETTKFLYGQMTTLGRAGITPTTENAGLLAGTFKDLHLLTGMTVDGFNSLIKDLAEDSDIRIQLAGASEAERKQILLATASRIKENVALGMSTEQATAAAKAMAKMVGETPAERIAKAARAAALAGALGIRGGAEYLRTMTLGSGASDIAKKQAGEFNTKLANAVATARGGPNIGLQQLVGTMGQGLEEQVGKDSPFQTILQQSLGLDDELIRNTKALGSDESWLGKSLKGIQQAITGFTSPAMGIFGGILGAVWKVVEGLAILGGLGGMGGVGGGLGKLGGIGKGALGKIGGGLGKIGIGAGLGFGASALGAGSYTSAGIGLGATIGSFVTPVIGTAVGAAIGGVGGYIADKLTQPSQTESPAAADIADSASNLGTINMVMAEMKDSFKDIARNTAALVDLNKKLNDLNTLQLQAFSGSDDDKKRAYDQGRRIGKLNEDSQPYMLAGSA